ncbi:MAG: hypothetical protein PVH88_18215 [Ignavibacteria bacterium]|jgi:uncharacterized membrane protein YraQ (UPF0718 family)
MKKNYREMTIITILMWIIALSLTAYTYSKGMHIDGFSNAIKLGIKIIPLCLAAILIVGMLSKLNLDSYIIKYFGNDSGISGIMLASLGGMLTPGGTFVALSMGSTLLKSGASIGSVIAYIIAYSTWDITRTPIEIGFLGWKYVIIKWCCILILPIIGGLTAKLLFSWVDF